MAQTSQDTSKKKGFSDYILIAAAAIVAVPLVAATSLGLAYHLGPRQKIYDAASRILPRSKQRKYLQREINSEQSREQYFSHTLENGVYWLGNTSLTLPETGDLPSRETYEKELGKSRRRMETLERRLEKIS